MEQGLLLTGLFAFSATAFLIRLLIPVAVHADLVDHPGSRKCHTHPTPLVGGIAMFIAFALAMLTLDTSLPPFKPFVAAAIVLVLIGVLDDHRDLSTRSRFAAQIVASLIMVSGGGVVLNDLGRLGIGGEILNLGLLASPFTVFAAVGVINATNMVDGLDGLAASLSLVTVAALMLLAWAGGQESALAVLVILAATALGFLLYNLRLRGPALVFMGDAGSMFLGFALAWFLVAFSQGDGRLMAPTTALWLFAVPLIDTVSVMIRRLARARSPFSADRAHFHHVLRDLGLSRRQTLVVMVSAALVAAAIGLAGEWAGVSEALMLLGFLTMSGLYHFQVSQLADAQPLPPQPGPAQAEPVRSKD